MNLTIEEKRVIIKNDFEIGRLEMLLALQKKLEEKKETNRDKITLINIGVGLGFLYSNNLDIDVSEAYDNITQMIVDVFELRSTYEEME